MKNVVSMATIVGHRSLTKEGSVKRTLEVEISLEVTQFESVSLTVFGLVLLCVCMCGQTHRGNTDASDHGRI